MHNIYDLAPLCPPPPPPPHYHITTIHASTHAWPSLPVNPNPNPTPPNRYPCQLLYTATETCAHWLNYNIKKITLGALKNQFTQNNLGCNRTPGTSEAIIRSSYGRICPGGRRKPGNEIFFSDKPVDTSKFVSCSLPVNFSAKNPDYGCARENCSGKIRFRFGTFLTKL